MGERTAAIPGSGLCVPGATESATFNLSCAAADLTNVAVTGPCAGSFPHPSTDVPENSLNIYSPSSGVCHVELTFATGFTYSTDVTFTSSTQTSSCCGDVTTVTPTQATFTVNNPSTTCVDAGDSDARADASTSGPGG
jgi:hypothetical protein